ncbi:MAG: CcdB family protein, partial [Paracoccaceae bacterium]
VVPLLPTSSAPKPATRLNPIFDFEDQPVVMVTQFMAAVPTGIIKTSVGKLDEEFEKITSAIDMLIQGF